METPAFLKPIQSYPGEIVQFIERIPGVDVTGDRETVLEQLEPYHKAEVEALGWRWKDLRRAEQVHGTRVALVGDIGSNYPVEGVDSLICSGVSDCVLAIYVADCAAVWLYDKENCHRSLIHSGKAGTAGNIVSNTIKSMKKCLGVDPANLIAVISPCIRPPHYEEDIPPAIKAQLEEGGLFKVDLQSTEWTQFNKDRVVTEDSDGSYPVYQLGWFPDYSDPDNYLSPFFRDGNFVNNGYSNKEVNDLIVKQAGETDAKAREDLLKEIQKLETDDLSTIPLLQGAQVAVTGSNVKGVVLDASFRFRYSSVTKA